MAKQLRISSGTLSKHSVSNTRLQFFIGDKCLWFPHSRRHWRSSNTECHLMKQEYNIWNVCRPLCCSCELQWSQRGTVLTFVSPAKKHCVFIYFRGEWIRKKEENSTFTKWSKKTLQRHQHSGISSSCFTWTISPLALSGAVSNSSTLLISIGNIHTWIFNTLQTLDFLQNTERLNQDVKLRTRI